jgi:hypothetical protein
LEEKMSKITSSGLGSAARNLKFVLVPALLACTSLTGCISSVTGTQRLVSAEPLDVQQPKAPFADKAAKLEYLGQVVVDSETKCSTFVNGLVLNETSANTGLDILGTVASALSTAFVPPGTKTALSAAATIATGSKTAIDTDIYDKAAISDFSAAIQGTYTKDILAYTDKLPDLPDTFLVNNEVAKIQSYHAECSLAAAESAVANKLGTPPAEKKPPAPPSGVQKKAAAEFQLESIEPAGQEPGPAETPTHAAISGRGDW